MVSLMCKVLIQFRACAGYHLVFNNLACSKLPFDRNMTLFYRHSEVQHASACSLQKRFPGKITQLLQEARKQRLRTGTL